MSNLAGKQILETYLSWKGRIGRGEFWAFGVALNITWFAVSLLARLFGEIAGGLIVVAAFAIMIVGTAGLMVKRGHDRGRPAAFSIVVLAIRVVLQIAAMLSNNDSGVLLLQVLVIGYVIVDYGVLPGQPKANRYGLVPGTGSARPQLNLGAEEPVEPALPSEPPKA